MRLASWLRSRNMPLGSGQRGLGMSRRRRARPACEPLEARTLMSATLVSVNQLGTASGNDRSGLPVVLSANGRFVAFDSLATDLTAVPDGNGPGSDLFVRDLQA